MIWNNTAEFWKSNDAIARETWFINRVNHFLNFSSYETVPYMRTLRRNTRFLFNKDVDFIYGLLLEKFLKQHSNSKKEM